MSPLVSVVVPVYNPHEGYLRDAIASVLAQTLGDLEVVLVDDGSRVSTAWLDGAFDARVRVLRQPNGGPASARNAGIRAAAGDLIAFLDGDDLWDPTKLAEQVDVLGRDAAVGLVYGPIREIDAGGRPNGRSTRPGANGRVLPALFMYNFIVTSTVLVRRRCLDEVGLFDEDREAFPVGEDYELWLRLADRFAIAGLPAIRASYRIHGGGVSRDPARSYGGERRVVERAVDRFGDRHPELRQRRPARLSRLYFEYGYEHFERGELARARPPFRESLRHDPRRPRTWAYFLSTYLPPQAVATARRLKHVTRRSTRSGG